MTEETKKITYGIPTPDGRVISIQLDRGQEVTPNIVRRVLAETHPSEPVNVQSPGVDTSTIDPGALQGLQAPRLTPIGDFVDKKDQGLLRKLFPDLEKASAETAMGFAGGVAGGKIGAPLGPGFATAGVVIGGMIGAVAGSVGVDIARDRPADEIAKNAAETAALDLLFSGGIATLGIVTKPVARWMFGIGDEAIEQAIKAQNSKIDVGIVDVSKSNVIKGTKQVLGIFPIVSRPFSFAADLQQAQVSKQVAEVLDIKAPVLTLGDQGVNMVRAAQAKYNKLIGSKSSVAVRLYNRADDMVDALATPEVVPTKFLEDMHAARVAQLANRPRLVTGDAMQGPKLPSPVDEYIAQFADLPSHITMKQLRAIQKDLNGLYDARGIANVDTQTLTIAKKATEDAANNLDFSKTVLDSPEETQAVKEAYDLANKFFTTAMSEFQTTTAKKFGRVDKKLFAPGASKFATKEADEIADVMLNTRSAKAVKDLRTLVGPELVAARARVHIGEQFRRAFVEQEGGFMFKGRQVREALGLTGTRASNEALNEMLRGTGVNAKMITEFVESAEKLGDVFLPSRFIARRLTLGGLATITALDPSSVFTTVPLLIIARHGAKVLTNPQTLKDLTQVFSQNVKPLNRRIALARLVRLYGDEPPKLEDGEKPGAVSEQDTRLAP